ncbi:dTMP kinase [Desertihabitans brevis]|uniref:Thymidylate kinase n=1 Tax=Desertihabitans brevis TaxID=2268447 RepID=A0A367YTS7_9ACTN|nr:dTMP kinase [Desertihabitans brevis]
MVTGPGLFVVLEGGDGVGKSTQARLLAERLTAAGHEVVRTREPGGTRLGELVRALLLDPAHTEMAPRTEALLYAADKAQHLAEVVRPAVARGAVVVSDRYVDSMLAYQGAGRVLDAGEVEQVARWATEGLRPDLTVLLDLDPEQAVGSLVSKDRLEGAGAEFHDRVRQGFLSLAAREPDRYLVLPARRPRDEIAAAVWARVAALPELSDGRGTVIR